MQKPINSDLESVQLHPTYYLDSESSAERSSFGQSALIILNSPIADVASFRRLYDHAAFRICADGGANRLYDLLSDGPDSPGIESALPDLIYGDLDSLTESVRASYAKLGVEITEDPDQYSTDFGKAIYKVTERLPEVKGILVLGSIGGRVDQGIGLLHELYREQKYRHPGLRFWFFSEASVSTLLEAGTTVIHTPLASGFISRNVGILPLYGAAKISTQGLEWDVKDWPTEMGGQVSTSNHIVADQISITTDNEVLFTVERIIPG